jgi:hypothetical protein
MKQFKLLFFFTFVCFTLFAQGPITSTKWKLKRISLTMGQDQDMLRGMDSGYFMQGVSERSIYNFDNLPVEEEYVQSMTCENPQLRLTFSLLPPNLKNTEIQVSAMGIFNRIDAVHMATPTELQDEYGYQTLNFDLTTHEFGLETSILKRLPIGRTMNIYLGGGGNVGYITGGNLCTYGQNLSLTSDNSVNFRVDDNDGMETMDYYSECMAYNNGISGRVFGHIGIGFLIAQRVELGLNWRRGVGVRAISDLDRKGTTLHSFGLSAGWVLR